MDATRHDEWTGEPLRENYPSFQVSGAEMCASLDGLIKGEVVEVSFSISGSKYAARDTGEERFFNRVRAWKIEVPVRKEIARTRPIKEDTLSVAVGGFVAPPAPTAHPTRVEAIDMPFIDDAHNDPF